MSEINIFSLIKAKKKLILLVTLLFVVIAMAVSLVQPLRYSSSLRLLVVQKAGLNSDPYAMSKANDYLSQLLSKVSYSNLFLSRVLATDSSIDSAYFGTSAKERAKAWDRTITVKSVKETGIITIEAYQPSREQAEKIARSIALTLMTQHANYHGMGDNVMIRLLDEPVTSTYPDQPNLLANFLISLFAGLAFGLAWAYLQAPEQKHIAVSSEFSQVAESVYPEQNYQEPVMAEVEGEEPVASRAEGAQYPWQQAQ